MPCPKFPVVTASERLFSSMDLQIAPPNVR